jgi:hypothetical protein
MATTYSCDRCDYITRDKDSIATISIPYTVRPARRDAPGGDFDLCDNCLKELRTFLQKKKSPLVLGTAVREIPVGTAVFEEPVPVPMESVTPYSDDDIPL